MNLDHHQGTFQADKARAGRNDGGGGEGEVKLRGLTVWVGVKRPMLA